jgi:hypothetical protein
MTTDERLDRLAERHQVLAESLEILTHDVCKPHATVEIDAQNVAPSRGSPKSLVSLTWRADPLARPSSSSASFLRCSRHKPPLKPDEFLETAQIQPVYWPWEDATITNDERRAKSAQEHAALVAMLQATQKQIAELRDPSRPAPEPPNT